MVSGSALFTVSGNSSVNIPAARLALPNITIVQSSLSVFSSPFYIEIRQNIFKVKFH
jgi:hypothetical protein